MGSRLGLAQQARASLRSQGCSGQHLNRHFTLEQVIVGAINDSHSTAPKLAFNLVTVVDQDVWHKLLLAFHQ